VGLHGQPGHDQALDQALERLPVSPGQVAGAADGRAQRALDQLPDPGVDRLDPEGVGDQPVGPGRDLAQQVAVAGRGHLGRGASQDLEVGHDGRRRRAGHGLLVAVSGDGRAEGGVAVHRGRRGHDQVRSPGLVGGPLDDVVEAAGADRHRDGVVAGEGLAEPLDVVVGGQDEGVRREQVGLPGGPPGRLQPPRDLLARDPPGGRVGDHHHRPVGEALPDDLGDRGEHPRADDDLGGVGRLGQRRPDPPVIHRRLPPRRRRGWSPANPGGRTGRPARRRSRGRSHQVRSFRHGLSPSAWACRRPMPAPYPRRGSDRPPW
jgi:hypothetical protein